MNKKGFTLIEVLSVIIILGIIITFAYPIVTNTLDRNKNSIYKEQEKRLEEAANKYLNEQYIPSTQTSYVIEKSNLISSGYIEEIYDIENADNTCEAYVDITNLNTIPNIKAYISCENYETQGYEHEYEALDYLLITGNTLINNVYTDTMYINTRYIPTINTKVEFTHIPLSVKYTPWIAFFGCREGQTNTNAFYSSSGNSQVSAWVGNRQMGGANINLNHVIDSTEVITLSSTLFEVKINDEVVVSVTNSENITIEEPNSIYLFSRNIGNEPNYLSKVKFISFKIYENDVLEKEFVPAKDPDGKISLYEKIDKEYYYNLGTGTFTE